MSTAGPDDAYLVRRAQDGFLDAYEELVRRHGASAYRVALRLLGDHHAAEDIAQEALVTGWQRLGSFRGEATFATWLYRIVTRLALNRIRGRRFHESLDLLADDGAEPLSPEDPPDVAVQRQQARDAVAGAVLDLSPAQRVVLVLYHFENLSYDDIAAVTGSTSGAVRSHLFRARRALAVALEEWG